MAPSKERHYMLFNVALESLEPEIRTTGYTVPLSTEDLYVTLYRKGNTVYVATNLKDPPDRLYVERKGGPSLSYINSQPAKTPNVKGLKGWGQWYKVALPKDIGSGERLTLWVETKENAAYVPVESPLKEHQSGQPAKKLESKGDASDSSRFRSDPTRFKKTVKPKGFKLIQGGQSEDEGRSR